MNSLDFLKRYAGNLQRKITVGELEGTMTPSRVTGGGTIWNPKFKFNSPLTSSSYNEWAKSYQQQSGNEDIAQGIYPTGVSGTEKWQYTGNNIDSAPRIATNPRVATAMGMPIDRDLVAAYISRNRGQPTDRDYLRADRQIAGAIRAANKKQNLQRRAR